MSSTPLPAKPAANRQLDLFGAVLNTYVQSNGSIANETLYAELSKHGVVPADHWDHKVPIGQGGALHSPAKRAARWIQQSLKALNLIAPSNLRGHWEATEKGRAALRKNDEERLCPAPSGYVALGFSTKLGMALWGNCKDVVSRIDSEVHCVLTSPPYPLARPRAYGGPDRQEFIDFITSCLEPVMKRLAKGASIALSLSNDIFEPGSPARSLYLSYLTVALHERLGLELMDQLCWHNPSKAPGPVQWASKRRMQLNVGYEPILWFTNSPQHVFSNNQRVLQPHTTRHQKLIAQGGEQRSGVYGDGANVIRPGAFSNPTAGRIPRNVLQFGHRCHSQDQLRAKLQALGLPAHGATMPLELARFLVNFLVAPGMLTLDLFAGWQTTGLACEEAGVRWVGVERMLGYVLGSAHRFEAKEGFSYGAVATPPVIA
jgi:DNA modification methylase